MSLIRYTVIPANPAAHLFRVSCLIEQPDPFGQVVSVPAWIPGSYMIRNFAKHIVAINASCEGQSVSMRRLDKDSWQCEPCSGALQLDYEVYAADASVRTAQLDDEYGFFNGTSLCLRVHGQESSPCSLLLQPPSAPGLSHWKVATAMPAFSVDDRGFGEYRCADYDELIDHPVAMGEFALGRFQAAGVPHEIALFGRHRADMQRLCDDLSKICEQHIYFFDQHAPIGYYLFLVRVVGEGYGGLEHRASSALICSRDSLPHAGDATISERYREFLGLCSHEYFHTWNIKRIKPAAFTPYDLQKENYTELLWAFEGITSYYDDLALVRSGLIDENGYLELLGQTITRVLRGKGRLRQTVAESSFYAWNKFYLMDENTPNAVVSYYGKGALIALCLDWLIRRHTNNGRSLDNVMQQLWQQYGRSEQGVPEQAIEAIACEIGGAELKSFFESALRATDELPLAGLLDEAGVQMHLRAAAGPGDKGGKLLMDKPPVVELGAQLSEDGGTLKVDFVRAESAAQCGGLSAGDIIIACNGFKAGMPRLLTEIAQAKPGDRLKLHVFRRDELREIDIVWQAPELSTCYLQIDAGADARRHAARAAWLQSRT